YLCSTTGFPERIRQTLRVHTLLAVSACDETGQSRVERRLPRSSLRCYAAVSCALLTKWSWHCSVRLSASTCVTSRQSCLNAEPSSTFARARVRGDCDRLGAASWTRRLAAT